MKPFSLISCILLVAAAQAASAAVTQFGFLNGFSGANEVGPNTSTNGSYTINTLSYDDSVGTFGTLTVNVSYSGLTGTANNSHIHGLAGVGTNAGVLQGLSFTAATAGTVSGTWAVNSSGNLTGLFGGLTYINLHSTTFGGGEWRGQLVPVPEPSTYALVGMGVAGLALFRLRRKA